MNSRFCKTITCAVVIHLCGCYTPAKEREIKDQLFEVKAKLLDLEKVSQEKGQTVDTSRRNIASTHTEIEKINLELQRIKGELETLKLAIKTGELPGSDPSAESVASRIKVIEGRLDAFEAAPHPSNKQSSTDTNSKSQAVDPQRISVNEIRTAFNSKKFSFVAANANTVIQRLKSKGTKEEIAYYEAESLFRLSRYREAALQYADFAEQFTSSARLSHSKLRMGDCFKQLGDVQAAKSYYKEILAKYPKSAEAGKARENLDAIDPKGAHRSIPKPGKTKISYSQPPVGRKKG